MLLVLDPGDLARFDVSFIQFLRFASWLINGCWYFRRRFGTNPLGCRRSGLLATTWSMLPFDLLLSISLGGGGGLEPDSDALSFAMGGGGRSPSGVNCASGSRGRSEGGTTCVNRDIHNYMSFRLTSHACPLQGPTTALRRISYQRRLLTLLVDLLDSRRQLIQPTTGGTQASQALRFCLSFFAFTFPSLRFSFLLFQEQGPPASESITPLGENVFDNHVNIDSSGTHPL